MTPPAAPVKGAPPEPRSTPRVGGRKPMANKLLTAARNDPGEWYSINVTSRHTLNNVAAEIRSGAYPSVKDDEVWEAKARGVSAKVANTKRRLYVRLVAERPKGSKAGTPPVIVVTHNQEPVEQRTLERMIDRGLLDEDTFDRLVS